MKNTGKTVLPIFFIFISCTLYAVEIETELSPSKIDVGESASLRIKITGKSSKVTPVKFPAINGLQITFSGSSRSFQFVNGKTWSGTVLSFAVTGEKKGEYKIPPFILETDGEKVSSREVEISVRESSSNGGSDGPLRGDVVLLSNTVYTGEPFIMRYFINSNDAHIEGFSEQPHVKGFVMKGLDEKADEPGKTSAGSFCLVPVDKGVHEIGGGSANVSVEISQGFFSMNGMRRISFPYKKITVLPKPSKGKPERFSGDVGEFKIEAEVPAGKHRLYEEIKIPVKISGRGNLLTLSKPLVENEEGIKTVIEERELSLSISGRDLAGTKNFLLTVIPQKEGMVNAGSIFIEYFNPYKKIYEKTVSLPVAFEVQKGENSGSKGEVQFSSDRVHEKRINYLFSALIVSVIAFSVLALILWERKKLMMIRGELGGELPDEDVTVPENKTDEILKNIKDAVNNKNSEVFLYNADRGINLVNPADLTTVDQTKYNVFKEKIYYCRYGGGVFADSEMNELSEWLRKNLK